MSWKHILRNLRTQKAKSVSEKRETYLAPFADSLECFQKWWPNIVNKTSHRKSQSDGKIKFSVMLNWSWTNKLQTFKIALMYVTYNYSHVITQIAFQIVSMSAMSKWCCNDGGQYRNDTGPIWNAIWVTKYTPPTCKTAILKLSF